MRFSRNAPVYREKLSARKKKKKKKKKKKIAISTTLVIMASESLRETSPKRFVSLAEHGRTTRAYLTAAGTKRWYVSEQGRVAEHIFRRRLTRCSTSAIFSGLSSTSSKKQPPSVAPKATLLPLRRRPATARPAARAVAVDAKAALLLSQSVGLGASAGGLEALEQFFGQVPKSSGIGFVVVQHLDPTRKGIMAELLQREIADDRAASQKTA